MFFKNLITLMFTEACGLTAEDLETALNNRPFRPCGSLEPVSAGWVPPAGKENGPLIHAAHGFLMVCLKREEKILPPAVVTEVVNARAAEIEERRGTPVRRKERDALRDEVIQDLMPRAFSQSRLTYAFIDPTDGWLVVDSASGGKTDEVSGLLRQCLGSLPVAPLATRERPTAIMTAWLDGSVELPEGVVLDSECELRSPEEDGGIARLRKHDLSAPEIQHHLEAGKEVVKLALTVDDRVCFVLDEGLVIKGLKFLDIVQEKAAEVETDDPAERFDADFAVMTLEVRDLLSNITGWFGGVNLP
jgi:recombination associated protein RdgC